MEFRQLTRLYVPFIRRTIIFNVKKMKYAIIFLINKYIYLFIINK